MTTRVRAIALVVGVAATAYGLLRLLDLGWANTRSSLVWLLGGVVLHDAVFAPIVLGVALLALRVLPRERLAPVVVVLVVLVPVTLLAIPELGRFGARADRPTLLDRPYWLGWSGLATLVVVTVFAGAVVRARRSTHDEAPTTEAAGTGGDHGSGDGGR
ncbi:MAG TPA: hypothetical protein VH085_09560 [Nocardioides sp.]|nr:hypothetical protein [Nocardioides sp.]